MKKQLYILKGKKDAQEYELMASNVKGLQKVLTQFLRDGASGFIWRVEDGDE